METISPWAGGRRGGREGGRGGGRGACTKAPERERPAERSRRLSRKTPTAIDVPGGMSRKAQQTTTKQQQKQPPNAKRRNPSTTKKHNILPKTTTGETCEPTDSEKAGSQTRNKTKQNKTKQNNTKSPSKAAHLRRPRPAVHHLLPGRRSHQASHLQEFPYRRVSRRRELKRHLSRRLVSRQGRRRIRVMHHHPPKRVDHEDAAHWRDAAYRLPVKRRP